MRRAGRSFVDGASADTGGTRYRRSVGQWSVTVASFMAVILLAACTAPTPAPTAVPTATPTPAPTPDPLARVELPIGVQIFEDDVTTDAFEQLRGAGVSWARGRALWKLIEPERYDPPQYDWSVTDWLFGDATAAGFRTVASVYANPSWAAPRECGPVSEGENERHAALWSSLVERYDGDGFDDAPNGATVGWWQVGNEVDFDPEVGDVSGEGDYGGCFGDDPAAYARHLTTAYRAAKSADPSARIGFGPVAWDRFTAETMPPGWTAPAGPYAQDFTQRVLESLYASEAHDPDLPFFDFLGLHNYNDNAHFWDDPVRGRELVARVSSYRAEQLSLPGVYDLREMPILISETGLPSSPSDEWTVRSEALQATYVGQTMVRAQAAGVIAAIWYTARDNIFGDCVPPHYDWLTFGLMRSDDFSDALQARCPEQDWMVGAYHLDSSATARPALLAMKVLTAALRGFSAERALTATEVGGDASIEAYLLRGPGGGTRVAAWAGNGQRLGARGIAPAEAVMTLDARSIAPWTGVVHVVDHLGAERQVGTAGDDSVQVAIGEAPIYVGAVNR